ncbi:MAG: alpha/beta hydrolase [Pirellulaceae bacterium]
MKRKIWWVLGLFAGLHFLGLAAAAVGQERQVLRLWEGVAPGPPTQPMEPRNIDGAEVAGRSILRLTDIDTPSLEVFPADPAHASGAAVIVCPGGGYSILAYDLEGTEIAQWLQGIGVTALVLKYRVPKLEGEEPGQRPLMDLQRAIRTVRSRAGEMKIHPQKIGVLGFSAGGHLIMLAGTQYSCSTYLPQDEVDTQSAKPDFLIPIYPAYLADSNAVPAKLRDAIVVTKETPPAFLTVTHDDADRGIGAALLSIELKRNEVPCELHIFVQGGHGYGLRESDNAVSQWPRLCEQWLRAQKIIGPGGEK